MRKNGIILFLSEGTSTLLMMLVGIVIARRLPVADFGKYATAFAFASIVAVVADSGMGMLAAKEFARQGEARGHRLNEIFSWRMSIFIVACAAAPFVARTFLPALDIQQLAFQLTPGVLLLGTTDFFCWIFKGAQRAWGCASLQLMSRALLLGLCVWAVHRAHPLSALVGAYSITGIVMVGLGWVVLARSMHAFRWVSLPREFFRTTAPNIYKMGAILMLSVAFTRIDVMIVARVLGSVQAGLYGAAGRVIDALRLFPMVIYSVYLPVFSAAQDHPDKLRRYFQTAHDRLLAFSVVIAIAAVAFSEPLFTHVLGAPYRAAAECFRPLVWSCVLMYSNILMFALLYALNDHRTALIGIGGALVVEVALDIALVPRYGIVAASWSRLAAESFNWLTLNTGLLRTGIFSTPKEALV